jgi:serine/threonine protein phosphatase PrpC
LRVESAKLTLQGSRQNNQDRVHATIGAGAAMIGVCDGMGGHADGERAAEIVQQTLAKRFSAMSQPLLDPLGFLHGALGLAHERVVAFGAALPVDARPRATCAVCLVQHSSAYWAHVGDSRIYHLRGGRVRERSRDHSHVERLLRGGVIDEEQVASHPLRNFVESCLGGDPILPEMTLSPRRALAPQDVLLVCTDGYWSGLDDEAIAAAFAAGPGTLQEMLAGLSQVALRANGATSDNLSAAALRVLE